MTDTTNTAPDDPRPTEWIPTTTLQALYDEARRLLDSGMPPKSTVTTGTVGGEPRVVVALPEPTAVDLLRQVAKHTPYKTAHPDRANDYIYAAPLTRGQIVAALNAAPLLLRLVDAHGRVGDGTAKRWSSAALIEDIVAELRGDR